MKMSKKKKDVVKAKRFSEKDKQWALAEHAKGATIQEVSESLGCSQQAFSQWKFKAKNKQPVAAAAPQVSASVDLSKELEEYKQLCGELLLENHLLKKALAR
jgi:transposase-like protein